MYIVNEIYLELYKVNVFLKVGEYLNYKYIENKNFEDYASGRVIYQKTGYPNFPVRLTGEIFMTCLDTIGKKDGKVVIYDPCCGGAYLLTVLGLMFGNKIDSIYASDISEDAVDLAKENLNLLTIEGLENRKSQLLELYNRFGKESHKEAILSADNFLKQIYAQKSSINCSAFIADITNQHSLSQKGFKADIVFTDIPYGNLVSWSDCSYLAIDKLLDTITSVLNENSIVALSSDKAQKITNAGFKIIRKIIVGKRKIELLQKVR